MPVRGLPIAPGSEETKDRLRVSWQDLQAKLRATEGGGRRTGAIPNTAEKMIGPYCRNWWQDFRKESGLTRSPGQSVGDRVPEPSESSSPRLFDERIQQFVPANQFSGYFMVESPANAQAPAGRP
jgi:hypothetical protein